jgi:cation diffusion facilitator CzcD-associated flavoprotein CzcO
VHTNAWPENLDITGKRVGVIGTGSTGTQFIVAAAKTADHLTVFQRSPQYCVPSGNGPVDQAEVDRTKQDFDAIWDQVRNSVVAFGFTESDVEAMSVSEEERRRVFQENWDKGNGFRFMFGTFCDIATNPEANAAAAAFIRSKIAEIVDDPETARKLTPTDLYAKRPLCNEGYYETYNRDNVELVSIEENPIREITPAGVRTADGVEHQLDVLVFATGFDAVDGNYRSMDLRGRGGRHIDEHWTDGPPATWAVEGRLPEHVHDPRPERALHQPAAEHRDPGRLDRRADRQRRAERVRTVEPTAEAEDGWTATCEEIAEHDAVPEGRVVDLRSEHPGQEEGGHVLHGRDRRLPAEARRGRRLRLRRVHDDSRERHREHGGGARSLGMSAVEREGGPPRPPW